MRGDGVKATDKMKTRPLRMHCDMTMPPRSLKPPSRQFSLSGRARPHLKVGRTIAILKAQEKKSSFITSQKRSTTALSTASILG
jgi:hypothetical protein